MSTARLEQLRKLAELEPGDAFARYGVALECIQLEHWAEAVRELEHVLTLDPQYIAAHMQKARVELKLGVREAAAATLRAGIAAARGKGDRHAADEMTKMLEAL